MSFEVIGCAIFLVLLGFSIFAGFYFGEIKQPDKRENYNCYTSNTINISRSCYNQVCPECICTAEFTCDELISNQTNGYCCDNQCCVEYECKGGWNYDSNGERYWDYCYTRPCVSWETKSCIVSWGTCWELEAYIQVTEISEFRNITQDCGYNDYLCVDRFLSQFEVNTTTPCWLNNEGDVVWTEPPPKSKKKWWIGAGFGIAFMGLGALTFGGMVIGEALNGFGEMYGFV